MGNCRCRGNPKPGAPRIDGFSRQVEDWQRRTFLKQAMGALAAMGGLARDTSLLGLVGAVAPELGINRAYAGTPGRRRHLINLVGWGGWEGSWWHNFYPRNPFANAGNPAALVSNLLTTIEPSVYAAPTRLTRFFDDADALQVDASPHHWVGKGMKRLFSDLGPDAGLADIAILKGLIQTGQHSVGNLALNQGGLSSYAKSYSSLISAYIAQNDYPRLLHYVANGAAPGSLFLNTANTAGYEVPVCIGDRASFGGFTQSASVLGFAAFKKNAEGRLQKTLDQLAGLLAGHASQASSRRVSKGYGASLTTAEIVSHSGWATAPEFLAIYVRYLNAIVMALSDIAVPAIAAAGSNGGYGANVAAMKTAMQGLFTSQFKQQSDQLNALLQQYPAMLLSATPDASLVPPSALAQANQLRATLKSAIDAAYVASPSLSIVEGSGLAETADHDEAIGSLAFSFAMAEFLVRFDLSAVVDAWVSVQDLHYNWSSGVANVGGSMACFRELVRALKATILADGTTLLSHTAVVMHTELDRNPFVEISGSGITGTNHGLTASALFAGYNIVGGTIVGGVSRGALEDTAFVKDGAPIPFGAALPVNASGLPDPNGTFNNVESVFPTVLALFGMQPPLQQITEYGAVKAIIRS